MRSSRLRHPFLSVLFAASPVLVAAAAGLVEGDAHAQAAPTPSAPSSPADAPAPAASAPGTPQPVPKEDPGGGGFGIGGAVAPGNGATGPSAAGGTTEPRPNPDDYLVTGSAGARAAGLAPAGTRSGDFMDTRLTWSFGDDDFLNATGVLVPVSPSFSIGDRPQYRLFFDNLNSRFAGRENLTHLVLYKKMPGFIENLTTEAAIVLRFDLAALASQSGNLNSALYDSGSYIRLFYKVGEAQDWSGKSRDHGISATFFPLDTDRMRLGYLYDISWGGTDARINESIFPRIQGSSPGFKIQYDMPDRFYGFVGFKTASIVQPLQVLNPNSTSDVEVVRVGETNYGFLAGAGVDPLRNLRFDLGAGYFQQGKFDFGGVRGKPIYTYGASGRIVAHKNMPVPQSVDFRLYRNDPMAPMVLFAPTKYDPKEVAFSVSAEGSLLNQNLANLETSATTKEETAMAGALQGVANVGYLRAGLTGIVRNLSFVERNVPGFIPFKTLPKDVKTDPELFGALTVSYHLPGPHLTPEIGGGVQLPSTFKSTFEDGGVPASRTVVVRRQGDESPLPYGKDRQAIVQMRLSLKWDVSSILSMVGWAQLVQDNNATLVVRDPLEGTASLRIFQKPTRLGAGLAIQARF